MVSTVRVRTDNRYRRCWCWNSAIVRVPSLGLAVEIATPVGQYRTFPVCRLLTLSGMCPPIIPVVKTLKGDFTQHFNTALFRALQHEVIVQVTYMPGGTVGYHVSAYLPLTDTQVLPKREVMIYGERSKSCCHFKSSLCFMFQCWVNLIRKTRKYTSSDHQCLPIPAVLCTCDSMKA